MSILWKQIINNREYEADLYRRLVYSMCLVDGKKVDFDEVKKAVLLTNEEEMYSEVNKKYIVDKLLAVKTGIRISRELNSVDMYILAKLLRHSQLKILNRFSKTGSNENRAAHENYLRFIVEMYNKKIEEAHNIQKDLDSILENQEHRKTIEAIVNAYVNMIGMNVFGKETIDIGQIIVAKLCIDNDIAPVVITPDKFDRVNMLVNSIWDIVETSTELNATYICKCREALIDEFDHMSKLEEIELKRLGITV